MYRYDSFSPWNVGNVNIPPHPTLCSTCMCASVCVPFLPCKCGGRVTSHPTPPHTLFHVYMCQCLCAILALQVPGKLTPHPTPHFLQSVCVPVFVCHSCFASAREG